MELVAAAIGRQQVAFCRQSWLSFKGLVAGHLQLSNAGVFKRGINGPTLLPLQEGREGHHLTLAHPHIHNQPQLLKTQVGSHLPLTSSI